MEVRWKNSFSVIHKILRLFVNTFTAGDKHYLLNRENFARRIQMQLSQKQKTFPELFFCIFKIYIKFERFDKKRRPSSLMFFWKNWLQKIWLDKCPKSSVSVDLQTDNTRNGSKIFNNLNDSTFIIITYHCGSRSIGRSLSQ